MEKAFAVIDDFVGGVVFGNGWLAFGGLGAVIVLTLVVRLSKGISV
jgi:hypothetical protein